MAKTPPGQYSFGEESTEHYLFRGAVISIIADGTVNEGAFTITEIDAPPKYENNLHSHLHNELVYVLDGEMILYVDQEPHYLTSGMTGFVPENRPHGFRVGGDDPLHVLAIFAPAGMSDFFREVGTPVETREIPEYHGPTEDDLDRMKAASLKYDMKRLGALPPAM